MQAVYTHTFLLFLTHCARANTAGALHSASYVLPFIVFSRTRTHALHTSHESQSCAHSPSACIQQKNICCTSSTPCLLTSTISISRHFLHFLSWHRSRYYLVFTAASRRHLFFTAIATRVRAGALLRRSAFRCCILPSFCFS